MSTIVKRDANNEIFLLKGASEIVVASCDKVHYKTGEIVDMTESIQKEVADAIKFMADQALRTIGIAYKSFH